jgi:MFS family permease
MAPGTTPGPAKQSSRWWIAFGSAAALVVGNGPISLLSFGVFMRPIEQQMGWDRAHLSAALALTAILSALCVPFVGVLMDRFGVKRILLPAICVFAINVAAIGLAPSFPIFMALTALAGITGAAQGPIGYQKSIASHFDRNRGLVTGIALSGVGIGTALVPQYAQLLIDDFGWRAAYFGMGLAVVAIALPAVIFCVREPTSLRGAATPAAGPAVVLPGVSLAQALRSRTFWILAIVVLSVSMVVNGSLVHTVPLLIDRGFSPARAAGMLGAAGLSTIAGRLLTGYLLDRIFAPYVAAAVFLLAAGGLALLANPVAPLLGVVGLGFTAGTEVNLIGYMVSRYFGLRRFGQLYGYLFGAFTIGSGLGPLLLGIAYGRSHSYDAAFVGFEIVLVLAGILILFVGRYPDSETSSLHPGPVAPVKA